MVFGIRTTCIDSGSYGGFFYAESVRIAVNAKRQPRIQEFVMGGGRFTRGAAMYAKLFERRGGGGAVGKLH